MAFRLEIQGNYFVITDTDTGISHNAHASKTVFNGNGGRYKFQHSDGNDDIFEGKDIFQFANLVDSTGTAFTDEAAMKLWLRSATGGGGSGGGGGGGDASSALQTQQLNAQNSLNTKIDALIAEQDNPQIITLLNDLKSLDANDALTQNNILSQLQALGLNTDTLETDVQAVTAAIQAAEAAELLRDASQLAKLEEVNQQNKTQGEAIVAAINGQSSTSFDRAIGKDSSNNTPIIRVIETRNGVKQPTTYENLDGSAYDLTATGGTFVVDQAITTQYQLSTETLRAINNNVTGGYNTDQLIEKYQVIDLNTNNAIFLRYTNLDTATVLTNANVIDTDLSRKLTTNPIDNESYHIVDTQSITVTVDTVDVTANYEVIQGIAKKVIRDDKTFVWVNVNGAIVDGPTTGTQESSRVDISKEYVKDNPITYPLVIPANTVKNISFIATSGSYSYQINDNPAVLMGAGLPGYSDQQTEELGYVNDTIIIREITAGNIVITGKVPATPRNVLKTSGGTPPSPTLPVNTNSNFLIDARDAKTDSNPANHLIQESGGFVTQITTPPESLTPDTFSVSANQMQHVNDIGNGLPGFQSVNPAGLTAQMTKAVANNLDNACYMAAGVCDFTSNSQLIRWRNPTLQVSVAGTNISYQIGTATFQNRAIADINLTAAETNGTKAIIIMVRRTTINSGANSLRELFFITENNPNPTTPFATNTIAYGSAATQLRSATLGSMKVNYIDIIDQAAESDWITKVKAKAGI